MKIKRNFISCFLLITLFSSCSSFENDECKSNDNNIIQFKTGKENISRATDEGDLQPMPVSSKIAIRMWYDNRSISDDIKFNTKEEAFLLVNNGNGECKYVDNNYTDNDNAVSNLYWNNRKDHIFIAYSCNNEESPSFNNENSIVINTENQLDPLLSFIKKQPTGGDNNSNKVMLTFEHQLSYVKVNVKADGTSVGVDDETITVDDVILNDIPTKASISTAIDENGDHLPTKALDDDKDSFSIIKDNNCEMGYSFSGHFLAIGKLPSICIKWTEITPDGNGILISKQHTSTYSFPKNSIPDLGSGKKYIYNISLKRGTIATITAKIKDWDEMENEYNTNGTIDK